MARVQMAMGLEPRPMRSVGSVLRLRKQMLEMCQEGKPDAAKLQRAHWLAAKQDVVFFANFMVWIHEPRPIISKSATIPFVLYPYQEDLLRRIEHNMNTGRDLIIAKSRDMGATWMILCAYLHRFLFFPQQAIGIASRTADQVDKRDDPKSLLWKIDFMIERLPSWIKPPIRREFERQHMRVVNPLNNSIISGETTTSEMFRGDRRISIAIDEFEVVPDQEAVAAATAAATTCRILISTPRGQWSWFAQKYHDEQTDSIGLHWSHHPYKARGLYTSDPNGNLTVLDPANFPEGYEAKIDGKLRSPWYDLEELRAVSKQEMAREYDLDFGGSDSPYFDQEIVERCQADVMPPHKIGFLEYNDQTFEPTQFVENPRGNMRLWCMLDARGLPPEGTYVTGADVSAGTGASNSVFSIMHVETATKVCEIVDCNMPPHKFAALCIAACKFFNYAMLSWEAQGPGLQFAQSVEEARYSNYYYRDGKRDKAGWASTREEKSVLLLNYKRALARREVINRCQQSIEELSQYGYGASGEPLHAKERMGSNVDPSGARAAHGDRVIADALATKFLLDRVTARKAPEPKIELTPHSFAGRLAARNPNLWKLIRHS